MMDYSELNQKFPNLLPIHSPPPLSTINGIGTKLYGSRDFDSETHTYVKTLCITVLFVPILMLRAYRVADAQAGWYFLGREPLSALAKAWNLLLLGCVLAAGALYFWNSYTSTPDYRAGRTLAEADRLAASGDVVQAAGLYRELMIGHSSHAATAKTQFQDLLDHSLADAPPKDVATVLQVGVQLQEAHTPVVNDLKERGLALADQNAEADPRGAVAILDAIAVLMPSAAEVVARRRQLLEKAVAQAPDDPEPAAQLAVVYEADGDLKKCESLLMPHVKHLGTTEGARILGHIFASRGQLDEAYALLSPYTEGRLKTLHASEDNYNKVTQAAQQRLIGQLEKGEGPADFYRRYKAGGDDVKVALVQEYVGLKLKDDPTLKTAQVALAKEAVVVGVALDLGIVLLHRAQSLGDDTARRTELQKAEKTFLAIRGLAGQTALYNLYLGQVYYWLGKPEQGRQLFDELLKAQNRDAATLAEVSQVLREVGAVSDARDLADEAYNKETDQNKKYALAAMRAVIRKDIDDQILWLKRANPALPDVKAGLSAALGSKALTEGKDPEAVSHLRQAIATYGQIPENEATLYNGALACIALFRATGDHADFQKGTAMLDKAVALRPTDSLILHNAATMVWDSALREIIGTSLDLKTLREGGSLDLLAYLFQDEAGRQQYAERVRRHPGMAKARAYLDKLLVLAPNNTEVYSALASLHGFTRDVSELNRLLKRSEGTELDLTEAAREAVNYYGSKTDVKNRKDTTDLIAHYEKVLEAIRPTKGQEAVHANGPATFAVAASKLAHLRARAAPLGVAVKADEVVRLAEEAHAAAPSDATYWALVASLCFRAGQDLARDEPTYAAMAAKAERSLGPTYLLGVAVTRDEKLRARALANPHVCRVLSLIAESRAKHAHDPTVWETILLRAAHPEETAPLIRALLGDPLRDVKRALSLRLAPFNAPDAFDAYWIADLAGKRVEGVAALRRCAALGVPLPFVPQ
jgi:hypothetical protein